MVASCARSSRGIDGTPPLEVAPWVVANGDLAQINGGFVVSVCPAQVTQFDPRPQCPLEVEALHTLRTQEMPSDQTEAEAIQPPCEDDEEDAAP